MSGLAVCAFMFGPFVRHLDVLLVLRRLTPSPGERNALGAGRVRVSTPDGSRERRMSSPPMQHLVRVLRQNGLIRFIEHFAELFPTAHLKDLVVDEVGPNRQVLVGGRRVVNFGSDSFLGLDQDPRVQEALVRGVEQVKRIFSK